MKTFTNKINLFLLLLITLFFGACSSKHIPPQQIEDTKKYAQKAEPYLKNTPQMKQSLQAHFDKEFNKKYFTPWHLEKLKHPLENATWGNGYAKKVLYAENHRRLTPEWFNKQISNSNFKQYNQALQKAITVRNSSLRVFPTISKIFFNPKIAGQGFPFDYNQNSGIKINSPLLISHYSKDRAWVFVQSSFTIGWLSINDIALVKEKIVKKFESGNYYIAVKDNFPLYKNGIFKEYIKLGTLFPKTKSGKYLTISKDVNLNGFLSTVEFKKEQIEKKPIKVNQKNIKLVFNELLNEPYGWGELLSHRDCSALTRDFIAPFGIYLERNSAAQKQNGKYYPLNHLSGKDKKAFILKHGTPFLTLVYLRGHIMLYIGEIDGEPLVFHNVWGVRTLKNKEQGRFIIGRSVVTTLTPGAELPYFDEKGSILKKVQGISNIIQKIPKLL